MILAVHHLGLRAPEPALSLAPYAHFLDVAPWPSEDGAAASWVVAPNSFLFARAGATPERAASVHATGIAHLCLRTRDRLQGRARLEAGGVRLLADPLSLGTGFHYSYARDREGRLLEMENAPFIREVPRAWLAHVAWVTQDLNLLSSFYAALLDRPVAPGARVAGNARVDTVAQLQGVDLQPAWITGLNLTLEFWRYHGPALADPDERQCGYTHVAFEVSEPMSMQHDAIALGATAAAPENLWGLEWPAVLDPDGNRLVFVAPTDPAWQVANLPGRDLELEVPAARDAYLRERAQAS